MEKIALVDANAYIGLNWENDSHHRQSALVFKFLRKQKYLFLTNNYLVSEIATVLLLKLKDISLVTAITKVFYSPPANLKMIQVDQKMQRQALKIFSEQLKPNLSFPDCTLIAQALAQKIRNIFTFDKNIRKFPLLKRDFKFLP